MTGVRRPLRPGDAFRVGRGFPRSRVDEETIDYLRVHYETDSPGLGRVVEVSDTGMVFLLWGHRFRTPVRADDPGVRPLGPVGLLLAKERLGEAILRREVEAGKVVAEAVRRPARQPLVHAWLRRTRGHLPTLEALGGRIRVPPARKAKSRLYYWLGRVGALPPLNGFLDHGMLIDRIGVTVELDYSGRLRNLLLDRILLHKNHSIHLIGIDLDAGEQRTFRLDKVRSLSVPGLGEVDRDGLYWELQALCMSREGWLWYWNSYQARQGRPPGPPIGAVGRALSRLGKLVAAAAKRAEAFAPAARKTWIGAVWKWKFAKAGVLRRIRRFRQETRPPSRKAARRAALLAEMPTWRRRLLRAIDVAGSGGYEQVTCLLPMNALLETEPARCRAYLRHLMELTLEEANRNALNHSLTLEQRKQIIAEAAEQRYVEFEGGPVEVAGGTDLVLTADTHPIQREFFDFYRTPRGQFTPAGASDQRTTKPTVTSNVKFMNFYPFNDIETISPRPMLFIAGETAHSREFSEDAYKRAAEPKELLIMCGRPLGCKGNVT